MLTCCLFPLRCVGQARTAVISMFPDFSVFGLFYHCGMFFRAFSDIFFMCFSLLVASSVNLL
jgi:hypothetical protein